MSIETKALIDELLSRGARIGQNVAFGLDVHIEMENAFLLEIQDGVTVGSFSKLVLHDSSLNNADPGFPILYGTIVLRKNCFIGRDTLILPGSDVGEDTVIGAGSLVKGIIKPYSVYKGRPAKYYCSVEKLKKKWLKDSKRDLDRFFYIATPKRDVRTTEDDVRLEEMKREAFEKMEKKK